VSEIASEIPYPIKEKEFDDGRVFGRFYEFTTNSNITHILDEEKAALVYRDEALKPFIKMREVIDD